MQFGLSEEQILLRDNVNRFLDDNSSLDRVRRYADGSDDTDIWAGLTELGVPALLVPEDQGGIGLAPLDAAIVADCLGAHIAPHTLSRHGCNGTDGLSRQQRRPRCSAGRHSRGNPPRWGRFFRGH